jgi:uncharacterized OsmC-like protein
MIKVAFQGKKRFKADARGHEVIIDVPPEKGGDDQGMMPTELFTVALSTCVGITAAGWLEKNQLSADGLVISAQNKMSLSPRRIEAVALTIRLEQPLSFAQEKELRQTLSNCPVMLTLQQPPAIEIAMG